MTHWTQTERTARAEHRCELCEEPILPGWRYVDGRGCGDDGWYRWPMHVGCQRLLRSGEVSEWWSGRMVDLADALIGDLDGIEPGGYVRFPVICLDADHYVMEAVRGVCAAVDAVAGAYR